MIGTCPYAKRCQFSHDPRVETLYVFTLKTRKKNAEDNTIDSYFWPPIPKNNLFYDRRRNEPLTNQAYAVPHHSNAPYLVKVGGVTAMISKIQAEAIYSMYNYFVDFLNKDATFAYEKMYTIPQNDCMTYNNHYSSNSHHGYSQHHDYNHGNYEYHEDSNDSNNHSDSNVEYNSEDDYHNYNEHTGKRRLNVFIELSEGRSI